MTTPSLATKPVESWMDASNLIVCEAADIIAVEQQKIKDDTGDYSLDYTDVEMQGVISLASSNLVGAGLITGELSCIAIDMMKIDPTSMNNEITKKVVTTLGEPPMTKTATATVESAEVTPIAKTGKGPVTMPNAAIIPAINQLLTGTGIDLASLVTNYNVQADEMGKLHRLLDVAQERAAKAEGKALVTTGKDTTATGELTFDVVMARAADIFIKPDIVTGKRTGEKSFSFEVPTLVWKDKAGVIVNHPECPEIDEAYQLSPIVLLKFLTAFRDGTNTWLFGHTGTGKSTFVEQVAARLGFPVSRVNLDSSLERADLVGHVALREQNGTTVSHYDEGILPRAMQRPGFLLLDEIDAGRPDILFVIQRALEGAGLMLTEDKGRIVKAHPLFRFAATANTRGQGDEYGMYQGTKVLNASLIDRFPAFIQFDYLKKEVEMVLIGDKHPALDKAFIEQIVVFANEVRQAFRAGEVFQTITPRGLDMLAKVYGHFDSLLSKKGDAMKLALEMTVYDKTTQDTVQKIRELADRCFK